MIRFVHPSSRLTAWALALGLAAAACAGGSGSSGFELRRENHAIDTVLDDGGCVDLDGFVICAADGEGFQSTPTPDGLDNVATNLDPGNQTPCGPAVPESGTDLMLCFNPSGFSSATVFRVALRSVDPNGPWHLLPAPMENGNPSDPNFAVDIPLPPADAAGEGVQIAVLVFFTDPGPLQEQVDTLGATGADFAFVSAELPVT